jgi:hypothetical protein
MRGRLTPVGSGLEDPPQPSPLDSQSFARIGRSRIVALARSMPDCQSAALACLVWQASRQERLAYGPYARRFLARLSGPQLVDMTGRPLRTVRHALSRLTKAGVIRREDTAPGKKAVYALNLPAG